MRHMRRGVIALAALAATAALAPATSSATVTVGSNLQRAPQLGLNCLSTCTLALAALDQPSFAAPGGIRSPVNGTIVRWRIRAGNTGVSPTALRVVRPVGANTYTGGASSATVTPTANLINELSTSVPISTGDLIGIDCCDGTGNYFRIGDGDSPQWNPRLGTSTRAPDDTEGELLVNADIEPTNTFSTTKPKAKKGKVKFIATVPNAGVISAGDPKDKKLRSATAAAKGPQLLRRTSKTLSAPGKAKLTVRLSKAAQKRLAADGTLKVRVKVAYAPEGGARRTKTLKVKFTK